MSWWKERAAQRRDARNTKGPETTKPGPGKKDTKRWCRGKFGIEHKPKCVSYVETKHYEAWRTAFDNWRILICTECGKELQIHAPMPWTPLKAVPEWVA